jgi:hypothetical protein
MRTVEERMRHAVENLGFWGRFNGRKWPPNVGFGQLAKFERFGESPDKPQIFQREK